MLLVQQWAEYDQKHRKWTVKDLRLTFWLLIIIWVAASVCQLLS